MVPWHNDAQGPARQGALPATLQVIQVTVLGARQERGSCGGLFPSFCYGGAMNAASSEALLAGRCQSVSGVFTAPRVGWHVRGTRVARELLLV
jgi:hypothetical protein